MQNNGLHIVDKMTRLLSAEATYKYVSDKRWADRRFLMTHLDNGRFRNSLLARQIICDSVFREGGNPLRLITRSIQHLEGRQYASTLFNIINDLIVDSVRFSQLQSKTNQTS